jgi:citrate lyase beta subunit
MTFSLKPDDTQALLQELAEANAAFTANYPGDATDRQPVHTVYGGANLYKAGVNLKLGSLALRALDLYAPNFAAFAKALGLDGAESLPTSAAAVGVIEAALGADASAVRRANEPAWLAWTIYERVREKLAREPVEEQRIDFEDGYGNRPDDEEDGHAVQAAEQLAAAMKEGNLPPFMGFRIKPFTEESRRRSLRTLDLFLSTLAKASGGAVPENFVVTLPKITLAAQVKTLALLLDRIEERAGITKGAVGIDLMIEVTQAIINDRGENTVNLLVGAGQGRVVSAAFGTYDYTASCNITAAHQKHTHPASDFARHVMQVSLAGTGITTCDGATTVMPIGPHKAPKDGPALSLEQQVENRGIVHEAWALHFQNIQHSLAHAYYQGWDLNPGQLPVRYAAIYDFFLRGLSDASLRLNAFIKRAAQATLSGNTFDDAATGQGLLNFFLRGIACGALTEEEALATGITLDELKGRSFLTIVENRSKRG